MGLISGLIATGVTAVSKVGSSLARKKREDKAYQRQLEYDEITAERNYQYGEMAADNAYERQLALNESQNYQNTVQDVKDAGLSVGLLYGGGGAGGSGGGRASQGGGAGSPGGDVAERAEEYEAIGLGLEAARVKNEQKMTEAEVEKTKAETENIKEQTATSVELTPVEKELTKQQAISQWIDNARKKFENEGSTDLWEKGEFGELTIREEGNWNQQQAAEIAKALSEAEKNKAAAALDTDKKMGYWQELLNATKNSDAEAIKAAAVKLAAEWQTGEYTNWKTWKEVAKEGVGAVIDVIKMGK